MEQYVKPEMDIVDLEKNMVIVTSGCDGGIPDENEGPFSGDVNW